MSGIGISSFSVTGLHDLFDIELTSAAQLLTAYLCASAAGILIGGWLADRTSRHDMVAVIGTALSGVCFLIIAFGGLPLTLVSGLFMIAGVAIGAVGPSRDLLIRAASPEGARGKVFGLVYSGLDAGSALAPTLFGFLIDRHLPHLMFALVAFLLFLSITTVLSVRKARVTA